MHRYIVFLSFTILLFALITVAIRHIVNKTEFMGKPTDRPLRFILGKIGVFGCWTLFLLKALSPDWGCFFVPEIISWIAAIILLLSVCLFTIAFLQLGEAAKMGITSETTRLRTKGIYGFCRNPLYLAVFIIILASWFYCPELPNFILGIIGIFVHHGMTLAEEKFLELRFGDQWLQYKKKVRRYL